MIDFEKIHEIAEKCAEKGIKVCLPGFDQKTLLATAKMKNDTNLTFHIDLKTGLPAYDARYDFVDDFREGLAAVMQGLHYFHILPNGQPAYPQRYSDISSFNNGEALVRKDGQWAKINKQGQLISSWGIQGPY